MKLNATMSRRLFLSIIADYDLNRSISKLVDNGIAIWVRGGHSGSIHRVSPFSKINTIVSDNAGW